MFLTARKSPDQVRFEPWGEFLQRHWIAVPLGVLAGLLTGLALLALTGSGGEPPEASLRVALTQEVVWPFYDPARDRVRQTIESVEFQEAAANAANQAGGSIDSIEVDADSGAAHVDITVFASSSSVALAVSELAAAEVVLASKAALVARDTADLDEAELAAAETASRIAGFEERIAALIEQERVASVTLAQVNDPNAEASRSAAVAERRVVIIANEEANREFSRLNSEITIKRSALAVDRQEVEVLRGPGLAEDRGASSRLTALGGAALAALIAMAASLVTTRSSARITSAWQITDGEQLPLLAFGRDATDWAATLTALSVRVTNTIGAGVRNIAFVSGKDSLSCTVANAVADDLRRGKIDASVHCISDGTEVSLPMSAFSTHAEQAGPVTLIATSTSSAGMAYTAAADTTIIVVRAGVDRVRDVRRAVAAAEGRGVHLAGICVLGR